jgi:urea transport system substrate-binding protein
MTYSYDRRGFLKRAGLVGAAAAAGGTFVETAGRAFAAPAANGVRLGIFADLTGPVGLVGVGHVVAYKLAVEDVNKMGGVLGKPLEYVIVDTQSNPSAAIPKVRQLIETKHVDVLIGGALSSTREAVAPIITQRAKKIYLYPMIYEGGACNENLFNTGAVVQQNTLPAIEYALARGTKTWALLGHDYVYPRTANRLARKLIESKGGKVVVEKYYPLDTTDFSNAVRAAIGSKAQGLVNTIIPPGAFTFYKQLIAGGWKNVIVDPDADHTYIGPVAAADLRGVLTVSEYFRSAETPTDRAIRTRFEKAAKGKSFFTGSLSDTGAYRAVRFIAAAINKVGSTDTAKVRAALVGMTLNDLPGGTARIEPDHHVALHMRLGRFAPDGSLPVIKNLGIVKPNQPCHF